MNIFQNIAQATQKGFDKLTSDINYGIASTSAFLTNPVTSITKGNKASIKQYEESSTTKNLIKGTANYLTLLGGISAIGKTATVGVANAVKSIIPQTLKGKVIAGTTASVVLPLAVTNPTKTLKVVGEAPTNYANFVSNVVETVNAPTLTEKGKNAIDIFKENPLIAGSIVAGGALLAGKTLLPLINAYETRENTKAIEDSTKGSNNPNAYIPAGSLDYSDQKNLIQEKAQQDIKTIEANTKAQLKINEQAFQQQKELIALTTPAVVAPSMTGAPAVTPKKKKRKKKKKKKVKKKKKKTRRSKKKKRKSIKRRKS